MEIINKEKGILDIFASMNKSFNRRSFNNEVLDSFSDPLGNHSLLNIYRECYEELNVFFSSQVLNLANKSVPYHHAMRIKRFESISNKFHIGITRMQDILGHRLIFEDLDTLYDYLYSLKRRVDYLSEYRKDIGIKIHRQCDYIDHPKDSAYRSLHVIFEIRVPDSIFGKYYVELQLRTKLQHYWSTAVETIEQFHTVAVPIVLKRNAENNLLSEERVRWQKFFKGASEIFAKLEKYKYIRAKEKEAIVDKYKDFLYKMADIEDNVEIKEKENAQGDNKQRLIRKNNKKSVAWEKGANIYEFFKHDNTAVWSGKDMLYTESILSDDLKLLYPNYFGITKDFRRIFT